MLLWLFAYSVSFVQFLQRIVSSFKFVYKANSKTKIQIHRCNVAICFKFCNLPMQRKSQPQVYEKIWAIFNYLILVNCFAMYTAGFKDIGVFFYIFLSFKFSVIKNILEHFCINVFKTKCTNVATHVYLVAAVNQIIALSGGGTFSIHLGISRSENSDKLFHP